MLVVSVHIFLIVPFWPIDLTWYYSYGCFLLSAETVAVMVLIAVAQKERLQGERMFAILPLYFFYNSAYTMLGIAGYTMYVFHLPIIVWTDTACHSSSSIHCLTKGAVVIVFILIMSTTVSFKFEVPMMRRIAAVNKFSSVFIGMISAMVLILCLILFVTKEIENPMRAASDLDIISDITMQQSPKESLQSHPLIFEGNSSRAYYTLIENNALQYSLLNEFTPFFRNQGFLNPIQQNGDKPSSITNLNLYETFDTIPEGTTISVLIVFKTIRSCPLLELLPGWIETQRKEYGNTLDSFHLLEIYESLLPLDKRNDGLSSPCKSNNMTRTLFNSVVLTDISKINNTKFKDFCKQDCQVKLASKGNILNTLSLSHLRLALQGMMTSITEQAPHLHAFFDSDILHEEHELTESTDVNVTIGDYDFGVAIVGDSTALRFGIHLKRLHPSIINKCQKNGINSSFMHTMEKLAIFNFGKSGINFPKDMTNAENRKLRNQLQRSIAKYDITVLMLSSMHLSAELITPNLAGQAFGELLSILNFFYSAGIERIYMVDYQYSYNMEDIRKGYRIPKKSFIQNNPLKGVNTSELAGYEGPKFLYLYFLRYVNTLWDRHEDFLRRIGNREVQVNNSCINDEDMRQTLCYGDLLDGAALSGKLLPHLMELKNMLRIINLSFMSCPSPKTEPSYIMCKQGGFGFTDMRPDGTHVGGKSGDFISANLLAQCIEDLQFSNLGDLSDINLLTKKNQSTLPFAPVASSEAMDICHFENIQMIF